MGAIITWLMRLYHVSCSAGTAALCIFAIFTHSFLWLGVLVREASDIALHYLFGYCHVEVELTERVFHHELLSHQKRIFFQLQVFIVFYCFYILGCDSEKLTTALTRWRWGCLHVWVITALFDDFKKANIFLYASSENSCSRSAFKTVVVWFYFSL